MFKNFLKDLRKKDKNIENKNNDSCEERITGQVERKADGDSDVISINRENNISIDSNIIINKAKSNTETKNNSKIANRFNNLKDFYTPVFSGKRNINDIIKSYVAETDNDEVFNELRLRYLSLYLFKLKITNERLSIKQLEEYIYKMSNPNAEVKKVILNENIVDDRLYIELKSFLQNQIKSLQNTRMVIEMDRLILSVFLHYNIYKMEQDFFIRILFKLIKEMNLTINITELTEFKAYLEQRFLYINNIQFWESEEEKLYHCNAYFMGRYIAINTADANHIISNLKEGTLNVFATEMDIKNNHEKLYSLYINGTSFIVNINDKDRLLKYYEYINEQIMNEVNETIKMIKDSIPKIHSELFDMIENYLDIIVPSILLDREEYIAFEHLISYNSFIAMQLLDSSVEERDNIIDKLREDREFFDKINSFIDTSYEKFVKVSGKYLNIPEENYSCIIWLLIRKAAINYFSQLWDKEYGIYLENSNQIMNLDEYIDMYCRCNDIPTKNIAPVGMLTYYLISKNLFPSDYRNNFLKCNALVINKVFEKSEKIELELFEKKLTKQQSIQATQYTINDIDLMDGHEFERFISLLFSKMGYETEVTKGSGDQGIDVIAEKNGVKVGIQTKCYSGRVTNKSVQEVVAGLSYYNCEKGIVITNSYFTNSALDLAESNGVVLWDRDMLRRKIDEVINTKL
ncbi:restriction endonuclease [Maledivibacter halophilus]|uniref:Predicted endonuclease distantly related to archaeal Holliday junction resolvase and Mrr-like restriction enzymes n=1 Tax=Maledivibacter halophilus TaxID=36842 RepID=A0A1T5LWG7_9FIRM|nr:restriction endonuclease [Maledivibacter halophilus]SKC79919.1 Predicted endonuclease distantly related to archaeal Holliday junction resolvase and Mrr-like restriction enzymes [Maledivibacter halophilus]